MFCTPSFEETFRLFLFAFRTKLKKQTHVFLAKYCSERSWRYTSRAYNRWLSWLHRHKNAGVSLPFVCIRCKRIATFESLFNLLVNLKVVNCYKIGFLNTFKVLTTKMKLDGMHRMKFWKIDNFWNGTQKWINGTQKMIWPTWKYFTTFFPQKSHY